MAGEGVGVVVGKSTYIGSQPGQADYNDAIHVLNVTNPGLPLVSGIPSASGVLVSASDVTLLGSVALVADNFTRSLITVNVVDSVIMDPSVSQGGSLIDVEVAAPFALGADNLQATAAVRIFDASNLAALSFRALLDFGTLTPRVDDSTGIAVDDRYVYLTAENDDVEQNGTVLYIGQYLSRQDDFGIAPTIMLGPPGPGTQVYEGQILPIRAQATDDVGISRVGFKVDGQVVHTDRTAPYEFNYYVPAGAAGLSVQAVAFDYGSDMGSSAVVQVSVLSDEPPTVSLLSPTAMDDVVRGERFWCRLRRRMIDCSLEWSCRRTPAFHDWFRSRRLKGDSSYRRIVLQASSSKQRRGTAYPGRMWIRQ